MKAFEAPLVLFYEHGAEVRVGDADEVFGTVLEGAPLEAGDTVLGDNIVDIVARGADSGALGEEGLDARDGAAGGRAGHGNDGLALAGEGGTTDEVDLTADAAVLAYANGLTRHLSLQVDLKT